MKTAVKMLYSLASELGLVERNNHEDAFHQLVYGITGKEHVGELTQSERDEVRKELEKELN